MSHPERRKTRAWAQQVLLPLRFLQGWLRPASRRELLQLGCRREWRPLLAPRRRELLLLRRPYQLLRPLWARHQSAMLTTSRCHRFESWTGR
jgi:hypothetical protein